VTQPAGDLLVPGVGNLLTRPPEWAHAAGCRGVATAEFDPWHPPAEASEAYQREAYAWARQVCLGCPVQVQCTRYALGLLELDTVEGMFGGLTPDQLRSLARRIARSSRKVAQHGTRSCYVKGCRCPDCRAANARGEHARRLNSSDAPRPKRAACRSGCACGLHGRPL
jgi:Transcription factor WhiB